MTWTCGFCYAPFEPRMRTQRWCSGRCRRAAWDAVHHARDCADCGKALPTEGGTATSVRCRECAEAHRQRAFAERAERIGVWWNEGLSMREIAARLGCTKESLGVQMVRLRRQGYDLPKRRPYYGNGVPT